jgi:energy-coupling factor transporter ATP-binding protein EcfA2
MHDRRRANATGRTQVQDSLRLALSSGRLAGALVHDPKLIILDEPSTGLDAGSARTIKGVLRGRVEAGCFVIMTAHTLDVAERLALRIGVMAGGALIAEGTLDALRCQAGSDHRVLPPMPRRCRRSGGQATRGGGVPSHHLSPAIRLFHPGRVGRRPVVNSR